MNRYEEKQEARRERYKELAEKAERRSGAAFDGARDAVAGIPLGQPILVGHYSEARHRAALKRQDQLKHGGNKMTNAEKIASIQEARDDAREFLRDYATAHRFPMARARAQSVIRTAARQLAALEALEAMPAIEYVGQDHSEWAAAWEALAALEINAGLADPHGAHEPDSGEYWQHMGKVNGAHQFRHRRHPSTLNRENVNVTLEATA